MPISADELIEKVRAALERPPSIIDRIYAAKQQLSMRDGKEAAIGLLGEREWRELVGLVVADDRLRNLAEWDKHDSGVCCLWGIMLYKVNVPTLLQLVTEVYDVREES